MDALAWSERQNIDTSERCINNWFQYGINPNDVNEENLRNNYVEIVKNYGDNIMYILVVFAYSDLKNKYKLRLPTSFCKTIVSRMGDMNNLQFKNPYLLILGLWVSNKDGSMNNDNFKKGLEIIYEIDEYKLTGADLLRYHNFWNNV